MRPGTKKHRPEELSLSYNGGKDCLVLLILILATLPSHFPPSTSTSTSTSTSSPANCNTTTTTTTSTPTAGDSNPTTTTITTAPTTTTTAAPEGAPAHAPFPTSVQALYIRPPSPFPEVDAFVASTAAHYHLDLATSDRPMKAALTEYLSDDAPPPAQPGMMAGPGVGEGAGAGAGVGVGVGGGARGRGQRVRAVFVGTRRTDPHGARLTHFDETDRDWPRFMRVHPVIDWHYREVWEVRLFSNFFYCFRFISS